MERLKCEAKFFCIGEQVGFVKNSQFTPIELNVEKFESVIFELIQKCAEKFPTADCLLKEALAIYTGCEKQCRYYKGLNLSDSVLYLKYRDILKNNPKLQRVSKNYKQKLEANKETVRINKEKLRIQGAFERKKHQ